VQHTVPAQHAPGFEGHTRGVDAGQQTPEVQVAPVAQRLPQVPQFRASVWRSVQTELVPVPQTTSGYVTTG